MRLPDRLKREPLVDTIFEIRFKSEMGVANVLPGYLFANLDGDKKLDRLPHADIPGPIRAANAELRYAPLIRIEWKQQFFISIGDYNLGISAKMPYPGWSLFKPAILEVIEVLKSLPFITSIERYSYKSTNVFEKDLGRPSDVVKFTLVVGENDQSSNLFQVRSESTNEKVITVLQIAAQAEATIPGSPPRIGSLIDIDIISNAEDMPRMEFIDRADELVTLVHDLNKKVFFASITDDVLRKLGPSYA